VKAGTARRLLAACILAMLGALALSASANAAFVTYTNSTQVLLPVSASGTGPAGVSSSIQIPGRPPFDRLEVTDVKLIYPGGGALDMTMALRDPTGAEFSLIGSNPACATMPAGSSISFSDGGAGAFGTSAATCPATGGAVTVKPSDARTLGFFKGHTAAGKWDLIVRDPNTAALPQPHLDGWSMRVTHAPLTMTATAKKQTLKKKLALQVTTDGDCTLSFGKDGKGSTTLTANQPTTLKVKLKPTSLRRLDSGGKAKIQVVATNDLGGSATQTVKIKVS
jgi:hypothetical protein